MQSDLPQNTGNVSAAVFHIQKFCTDDGPGIRTTVFLKGCPLHCAWCHNPEGLSPEPVLEYNSRSCVFCKACLAVCPQSCHSFTENEHLIDRTACIRCGACVSACRYGALSFCGKTMTTDEVMQSVMADAGFYAVSGGGLTISGGEPLIHPEFVLALCKAAKEKGLHVCIETSGAVPFSVFERTAPFVDLFLFDIKETDDENHKKYIGISNRLPQENIRKLDALGASFIIRCPIIPGVNNLSRHFQKLKELKASLPHAVGMQLMPYHMLGQGKTDRFGVTDQAAFTVPTPEEIAGWNREAGISAK